MSMAPPPWIVDRFNSTPLPPIESLPKELAFRVIVPRPDRVTVPVDESDNSVEPNWTGADKIIWPLFAIEEPVMLRLGLALVTVGSVRLSEPPMLRSAIPPLTSNKTAAPESVMHTLSVFPGSLPFDQFAPLLQLSLPPPPVQLSVHWASAGVAPASETATIAATNNTNLRKHFSWLRTRFIRPPGRANESF